MGGVVSAIGNVVGGVGGLASGVAGSIPGIGKIAGPIVGGITGGPLGFASSLASQAIQGNYGRWRWRRSSYIWVYSSWSCGIWNNYTILFTYI
jgi:hypothetical protein